MVLAQNRAVGEAFAAAPTTPQPAAPVTPTPTFPPSPGVARPPTPQAPGAKPEEQLRIVADPATNSLIIYGTAQEFQNIKNILRDLDQIPRQVLIDALILQVDLSNTETFGVTYEILRNLVSETTTGTKTTTTETVNVDGSKTTTTTTTPVLTPTGKLLPGVGIFDQYFGSRAAAISGVVPVAPFGVGLSAVIGTGNAIRAFLNTLGTDGRIKILSSPSVLAADNRPARISVGQEVPVATGTTQQPGGTTGSNVTTSTIQYRNTGRILTIIPQINSKGLVNLQIKAEVSAPSDSTTVGSEQYPSFNTQDAETTAVVQDGETLVIGGLIGELKSKSRTGIPYLMDLPVVGRFFGSSNEKLNRTELIMLITPRVIHNFDDARRVTDDFKNSVSGVRNELERIQRDREMETEKMKRLRPEPPTPASPMPPSAEPQQPPVTAPARPGASFGPVKPPVSRSAPLVESSVGRDVAPPPAETQGDVDAVLAALEAAVNASRSEKPVAAAPAVGTSSEKLDKAPTAGARTAVPRASKVTRVWVVQVGAYAQAKEAELVAKRLRDKGHIVHVITADVVGKTWHKIQVGELASRKEALDLQKNLQSSERLEQVFVTTR
jgi:Flp pilus assembly secretin CpaC